MALGLLAGGTAVVLHFFGDEVVPPAVDAVRGVIGSEGMAEIEARYYGFVETTHQWQREAGLAPKPSAPWGGGAKPPSPDNPEMPPARRPSPNPVAG
ncbi:MAG: hypothetical protein ACR2M0_05945, partial [Chloroflexia bacterium]